MQEKWEYRGLRLIVFGSDARSLERAVWGWRGDPALPLSRVGASDEFGGQSLVQASISSR